MSKLQPKTVSESMTTQVQIVLNADINGYGRLFGGKLMQWIDIIAGVVAMRHSNCNVTTAFIDRLQFKAPAHANDIILLVGKITYVGKTSMEVRVDTFVEGLDGHKKAINHAYIVMVALDENDKPTPVPPLLIQTEQEKAEWEAGQKRFELRKQRQVDFF